MTSLPTTSTSLWCRVQALLGDSRIRPVTDAQTNNGACGTLGPITIAVASYPDPSRRNGRDYGFGAGASTDDARARAVLEAAERYSTSGKAGHHGSAAAFGLDEAIVAAFVEAVERDAIAIWWYGTVSRPAVDTASFGDPFVEAVTAVLHSDGHQVTVFDITSDTGIPVMAALSVAPDQTFPLLGFGAHFDARRALRAAVRELAMAMWFLPSERRKWHGFTWQRQKHLTPTGQRRSTDFIPWAREPTVEDCHAVAAAAKTRLEVDNCTQPMVGLPCATVYLPGFSGPTPQSITARVTDVPARMGWTVSTSATDLNQQFLRM